MNNILAEKLALEIDRVEADLVRLQSRLWSIRQRMQEEIGKKIGHQYDEEQQKR
jgi:hypothetical protein